MIPDAGDDKKKAFTLHEQGWYQDSFDLCTRLLAREKDPSLEVLAATNLFFLKRYDDAETYFRDLNRKLPDSSYVHSYLAKVLAAKGDDTARGEFAAAVRLDPDNLDALRSYAGYILATGDTRGATPVLRRLDTLSRKKEDAEALVTALLKSGEYEEAVRIHTTRLGADIITTGYLDALLALGQAEKAAEGAARILATKDDQEILRRYLRATAIRDPDAASSRYEKAIETQANPGITADFVTYLTVGGNFAGALRAIRKLSETTPSPDNLLLESDILEKMGRPEEALAIFEKMVTGEIESKSDPALPGNIIRSYHSFLKRQYPDRMKELLIDRIESDVDEVSLVTTGQYFEETGNPGEARAYYYRAFRSDFFSGGISYVQYLLRIGDYRECEKTLLYIISNVRRIADLERVAGIVASDTRITTHMKRLVPGLLPTLERRRSALRYEGLEYLAVLYHRAAKAALDSGDALACKENCLRGIDAVPPGSRAVRLEDFTVLLRVCKDHILIDTPVLPSAERPAVSDISAAKNQPSGSPDNTPDEEIEMDNAEKAAVAFLMAHRTASEMELRKILKTRRVTGIMNRLIRKMQEKGRIRIEKRGVGEQGEVYEYDGHA
ncbi:MAG: hypothetical protein ABFC24_01615 [Methanoregulaceae archaeon]